MTPRALMLTALTLLACAAVWAIGRSSAEVSAAAERVRIAEERETIAVRAYHDARDSIPALTTARERAEARLRTLRTVAAGTLAHADTVTKHSANVLSDTSATVLQLRGALYIQVAATERVVADFHDYLATDAVAHQAMTAERAALLAALGKADTALVASQRVSAAYKSAATCRVLWIRCPTRTQAFVVGAVATVAVFVAVR